MRGFVVRLLVVILLVTLTEIGTGGFTASGAAGLGYTFKDEVTKIKVDPVDFTDFENVDVAGDYLTWIIHEEYYHHIYALNLKTGETKQITLDKTYKYPPNAAQTNEGPMFLWTQSNESDGHNVWSYNLKTNEKKMRTAGSSSTIKKAVGDGNYLAWASDAEIQVHDLTTGKTESIGKGNNPQLRNNLLIYEQNSSVLVIYDLKTKSHKDLDVANYDQFSFNGKQILLKSKLHGKADYSWYKASAPEERKIILAKNVPFRAAKIMLGKSYGVWVEKGEGSKVEVAGVDLLYKESFPMPVEGTYNYIIGFSGDTLIYLNKDRYIVKRSIVAPPIRSDRNFDPITIIMDGEEVVQRVSPMLLKGSTYVEFRTLFEKMGYLIKWDNKRKTITGTKEGMEIKLTIDRNEIIVNGNAIKTNQAPVIRGGTTYVPLRLIGEAAERIVSWNETKRIVFIRPKDTKDTLYNEDGTVLYHGDLVNGVREGYGTLYRGKDQIQYVGEWKNDKMHGKGKTYYFGNELFFEGTMEEGERIEGVEYYPGGALRYEGTYYRGGSLYWEGLEGVSDQYSGEYLLVEIKEGERNGKAILYDASGMVKIKGTYEDDRFIDGTSYDEEGNVVHRGEFDVYGKPVT